MNNLVHIEILIEGVRINLTPDQVSMIQSERKKRALCYDSFKKMLFHFGFKPSTEKMATNCYWHEIYQWHAEILDRDGGYVWMIDKGLKSGSFPVGWIYWTPADIEEEITRFLTTTDMEVFFS